MGTSLPTDDDDDDDGDNANDGDNVDGTQVFSPDTIVNWSAFINVLDPALLTGEIRHSWLEDSASSQDAFVSVHDESRL